MPSVFTKIIDGEIPARFIWKDDRCVAFLTINPIRPGHTLVVPRREVNHWIDLEPGELDHLMRSAQAIGKAIEKAYRPPKVGMMLAGLEVPHVHVHLVPIRGESDLEFRNADPNPDPAALDEVARLLKERSDLRVFVVGHTDMQGSLDHNMNLSRERARAVVVVLANDYGIAESRLEGHGVGPLAPQASNASDGGRALNRRVVLVAR